MSIARKIMMGAAGAGSKSTYVDDVFSTYLYKGNGNWTTPTPPLQTINTGLDMSGEGGLLWIKQRAGTGSSNHILFDTVRGVNKNLKSDSDAAEVTSTGWQQTFTSTGFTLNNSFNETNANNETYSSWSFRKAPGFFDIVTYTGNGTGGTSISHNLGSIPGMMIVKKASGTGNWAVYHRKKGANYITYLNLDSGGGSTGNMWWNTEPTSTHFTVGADNDTNANGATYVAYLFAGGSATQQYSVKTNAGSSNYMSVPTHSDLNLDGDFTVEFWHKRTTTGTTKLFSYGNAATNAGIEWYYNSSNVQKIYINATEYEFPNGTQSPAYKWVHYAISRQGTNTRVFVDGRLMTTYASHSSTITGAIITGNQWAGSITAEDGAYWSNLRVVKGTAVYTAAFTPPQSALTNITNTKLLCWNSSTTTGATVSPVTIAQNGTVTSESDTPSYSDPDCFKFGEGGDKNIVATGLYEGNGSSNGPEINLGWEPSFIFYKNIQEAYDWRMYDSMRGIETGGNDNFLAANKYDVENTANNKLSLTPTGFKVVSNDSDINGSSRNIIYICIRRPDPLVGKPAEAGTDVYNAVYGNSSSTIPNFPSNFPVDMGIYKQPLTSYSWYTHTRLTGLRSVRTDTSNAQSTSDADATFDGNAGWGKFGYNTDKASWMWKRHAGFDVVAFEGTNSAGLQIHHNLSKVPEMIWTKNRDASENWAVYHKDLNGGTNPEQYAIRLNSNGGELDADSFWNDTAPTATYFTVGNNGETNGFEQSMLAMLFASVDGISKVGNYTGNGSASGPIVTLGFAPRLIIIKCTTGGTNWFVYDTLRGLTSGNDARIYLDLANGQTTTADDVDPTATGFQVVSTWDQLNGNNEKYLYYAHA